MKTARINRIGRCWLAATTLLAGGTVLGTCELSVRDALVTSSKSLVFDVFQTALEDFTQALAAGGFVEAAADE